MKTFKKIAFSILGIAIVFTLFYVYEVHFDYRFTEISEGKVYRSGVIPPKELPDYIEKYGIKTVIDLRRGTEMSPLNPALSKNIYAEKSILDAMEGVEHVNIPSGQIPTEENLSTFFSVLDDDDSYPVLIHCHHGTGRAVMYSALYRVEYEDFTNEEARLKTKFPVFLSSFDHGTKKGEWLKKYERKTNANELSLNVN